MWIKSLDDDVWVNMIHITDFSISETISHSECKTHEVYAWLDTSRKIFTPFDPSLNLQEQAFIIVCQGTYEKCNDFVERQISLQTAYQWLGYIVAGGIGAVLTLWFQRF